MLSNENNKNINDQNEDQSRSQTIDAQDKPEREYTFLNLIFCRKIAHIYTSCFS